MFFSRSEEVCVTSWGMSDFVRFDSCTLTTIVFLSVLSVNMEFFFILGVHMSICCKTVCMHLHMKKLDIVGRCIQLLSTLSLSVSVGLRGRCKCFFHDIYSSHPK